MAYHVRYGERLEIVELDLADDLCNKLESVDFLVEKVRLETHESHFQLQILNKF